MKKNVGLLLKGPGRMEVTQEELTPPHEGQVLIRIDNFNLCGSDLGIYDGTYSGPVNYPIYVGHEWAGTVEQVGPGITDLSEGDTVTGDCSLWCGSCEYCSKDKNLCEGIEKVGMTRNGAARRYFVQNAKYVYPAPEIPLGVLSLAEPLAVGSHAASVARKVMGDLANRRILILGGGNMGLSLLMILRKVSGCSAPEVYDPIPYRMEKAISLGGKTPDDLDYVSRQSPRASGGDYRHFYSNKAYDIVFESTGSHAAFPNALEIVKPLGGIGVIGFVPYAGENLRLITLKALKIWGTIGGTGEFPRVLEAIRRDPDYFEALVTHRFPYTDFSRAFETAKNKEQALKVQISFSEA